jgi:tRNA-(ms[2]io[6]A)-hydroxylase
VGLLFFFAKKPPMLCLKVATDSAWAAIAMRDVDAVLLDHAQCELKAASNALSLAARHPADRELVLALTDLAREEIDHFQRVLAALAARGISCGAPIEDAYAADLRRAAATLPRSPGVAPLVDRLLVAALIEARSCERFKLLAEAAGDGTPQAPPGRGRTVAQGGAPLAVLWDELFAAEAQHYTTFVDLAVRAGGGDRAETVARLDRIAEVEAAIVSTLHLREPGVRARVHG